MPVETSYSQLRQELASYLDRVVDENEVVIVRRLRRADVALIQASELAGLMETAHLLRSPANARRLSTALRRAERGGGKRKTVEELRQGAKLEKGK
jgi:antitoxin YefM